jgi:ketosteroid isomerase-like protein
MAKGRVSLAVTALGGLVALGLVPYLVRGRSGAAVAVRQTDSPSAEVARKEIEAFNVKFLEAHQRMDNAAIVGMWAQDGVSLLPETPAIAGRKAIAKFIDDVVKQMPGYHMRTMELDFQGIEISGDWASEWATEHQIVDPPPGKPVFEGYGKMLLVLHKESDGIWRIKREMWNQGVKP